MGNTEWRDKYITVNSGEGRVGILETKKRRHSKKGCTGKIKTTYLKSVEESRRKETNDR